MTETKIAPGLTLGPQDPDSSSELTRRVGVHNKADQLLKRHAANWPLELTLALSRPKDEDRSETLDLDEVEHALQSLQGRRAFFKDDDELEAASVRGVKEKERVVSVVFRKPSGRSAQGVIPYAGLSRSEAAYRRLLEDRDAGRVPGESLTFGAPAVGVDADARVQAAEQAARDAEAGQRDAQNEIAELRERLEALEGPQEPFEGYQEMDAAERAARVREGGYVEFGQRGLEAIREAEESRARPSRQVLSAVDDALATIPSDA